MRFDLISINVKHFFLITAFLWCSFSIGQSILLPSDNIRIAFDKQYPGKKPIWVLVYGKNDDDIRFVANFKTVSNIKAEAVYDVSANFLSYKEPFSSAKLPKNALLYLDTNYSNVPNSKSNTKTKSRAKPKTIVVPLREAYCVVDAKNNTTYEVMVKKDKKNYNLIFDSEGTPTKIIKMK